MATLLAVGAVGMAQATELVSNGDFSTTSPAHTNPTQFGANSGSTCGGWGGQFVSGWTGNGGYGIWYPSASAASGTSACTTYGNGSTQRLPTAVTAPPAGSGSFIGLDGQHDLNFGVSQSLNGLSAGSTYSVSFYWGATQEMSREGATNEMLQVALGSSALNTAVGVCGSEYAAFSTLYACQSAPSGWTGQSFLTPPSLDLETHGWTGWMSQSFTFTAGSGPNVLSFLSIGTPGSLPPFAVLADVSMSQSHNVPEPADLAMFGGGLLGLGLLVMAARRREMHRRAADGNRAIL